MKNRLAKLIDLKSIITLIMTIGLVIGFIVNKVSSEQFVTFVTMVFTFYFSKTNTSKEASTEKGDE